MPHKQSRWGVLPPERCWTAPDSKPRSVSPFGCGAAQAAQHSSRQQKDFQRTAPCRLLPQKETCAGRRRGPDCTPHGPFRESREQFKESAVPQANQVAGEELLLGALILLLYTEQCDPALIAALGYLLIG